MEEGKMVWAHVIDVSFFRKKKKENIFFFINRVIIDLTQKSSQA